MLGGQLNSCNVDCPGHNDLPPEGLCLCYLVVQGVSMALVVIETTRPVNNLTLTIMMRAREQPGQRVSSKRLLRFPSKLVRVW